MTKEQILTLLTATTDYLSGEEMSEKLGISRTAVWKQIKSLQQEGYEIEGLSNKGYRLVYGLGLREAEIAPYLKTDWLGRQMEYQYSLDSTNQRAKVCADEGAPNGFTVLADIQTAGKGRLGRQWQSPPRSGIWCSVVLRPPIEAAFASQITLVAAVAVNETLRHFGVPSGIKWPNDILVGSKKICGILTEMRADLDGVTWVVCGMGINVAQQEFPAEIAATATSVYLETGKTVPRSELVAHLLCALEQWLTVLYQQGFAGIRTAWLANNLTIGKLVTVSSAQQKIHGIACGLDQNGFLQVETAEQGIVTIYSGDVTLRV